jgi:hypothetical protein
LRRLLAVTALSHRWLADDQPMARATVRITADARAIRRRGDKIARLDQHKAFHHASD